MSAADRLAQIRARAEAATPGPWEAKDCGRQCCVWVEAPGDDNLAGLAEPVDAAFIAHAREDIPALLAAVEAALALADRWEYHATRWGDPLPVPEHVFQVRAAITEALTTEATR